MNALLRPFMCFLGQEFQPSGPQGKTITIGDFVRDILLEQVWWMLPSGSLILVN